MKNETLFVLLMLWLATTGIMRSLQPLPSMPTFSEYPSWSIYHEETEDEETTSSDPSPA